MIGLPDKFLHCPGGSGGGGVIQTTASEATLVCLLAARTRAIRDVQQNEPDRLPAEINSRLVAYCSDQVRTFVLNLFLTRTYFPKSTLNIFTLLWIYSYNPNSFHFIIITYLSMSLFFFFFNHWTSFYFHCTLLCYRGLLNIWRRDVKEILLSVM